MPHIQQIIDKAMADLDDSERVVMKTLTGSEEIAGYVGPLGRDYSATLGSFGSTAILVLPELTGCPVSDAVLSLVHGLKPSSIRVSKGEEAPGHKPGRVTIRTKKGHSEIWIVTQIIQEVECRFASGGLVSAALYLSKAAYETTAQGEGDRKSDPPVVDKPAKVD